MQTTPNANRLHIAIFGRRNAGKSSLLNAITGQNVAIVSDVAGTTADPVSKPMEVHPLGPCVFIDTAGYDDVGELGALRVQKTAAAIAKTDVALVLFSDSDITPELDWIARLGKTPYVAVISKADLRTDVTETAAKIREATGKDAVITSASDKTGIDKLKAAIAAILPEDFAADSITRGLVSDGDTVLLVMPQDIQAPKGRLILPQVQTIRELLDKKCVVMSCTTDRMDQALQSLAKPPKLIITDSQVFPIVYEKKPEVSLLTSFSVLFAAYKGDIDVFVEGAKSIASLTEHSHVLIAEACTHAPQTEDIGRVKIPALLRKRFGQGLSVTMISGADFPEDLSPYDLIIHCGACMFNRRHVLSRVERAQAAHVPMTNYGVTIAFLTGILDKVVW